MSEKNTFYKVNIKTSGYSFVWLNPTPTFGERVVDGYLPETETDLFGPNVAFNSTRTSPDTFFVATTSSWPIRDEYGRLGLYLSQGKIIEVDREDPESVLSLYESFVGLLNSHRAAYETFGVLLERAANELDRPGVVKLLEEMNRSTRFKFGERTAGLVEGLSDYLRARAGGSGEKIRVYTRFPWADELGLCALVGLQLHASRSLTVGGGFLDSFEKYQYVSTPQDVDGFEYIDLNREYLAGRAVSETARPAEKIDLSEGRAVSPREGDRKGPGLTRGAWERLAPAVPLAQVLSALLVVCAAFYLAYTHNRHHEQIAETLKKLAEKPAPEAGGQVNNNLGTPPPAASQNRPAAAFPQDQEVSKLLDEMFGDSQKTREAALAALSTKWKSDGRAIQLALEHADGHRSNKVGVINTLSFLQQASPPLLRQQREQLDKFLEAVKANGRQTAAEAEKVRQLLSGP